MSIRTAFLGALAAAMLLGAAAPVPDNDPYLWLSDIHGQRALAWVSEQNAKSNAALMQNPLYAPIHDEILKSLDTKDRIPLGEVDHGDVYNFWQDKEHVRGLWRKTTVADYRSADPHWDVLLDVDKLDADKHKIWVFHGARCAPGHEALPRAAVARRRRCVGRSSNTIPWRTVSSPTASISPSRNRTPQYVDADTIIFSTDFGPGTLTISSYPRIVKLWHRGQPISRRQNRSIEAQSTDISAEPRVFSGPYGTIVLVNRGLTFFTSEYFAVLPDGSTLKLPVPVGVQLHGVSQGQLVFTLRNDWTAEGRTFKQGSLLAFDSSPL